MTVVEPKACSLVRREAEVSGKEDEQSSSLLKKRGKSQRIVSSSRLQEGKHQHGEVLNPKEKTETQEQAGQASWTASKYWATW